MELLFEGYGIMGFVDGSNPCPARFLPSVSNNSYVESNSSLSNLETNEYKVWKMHDSAIMQLITATLLFIVVSYAIGSSCSKDLWTKLKEHFSTVSKTSICVMQGKESVISFKEFQAQLRAEEAILETNYATHSCLLFIKGLILGITKGTVLVNPAMSLSLKIITKTKARASFIKLCNQDGHTTPYCNNIPRDKPKCFIYGKSNHIAQYCFHKDKGPQFQQQFSMPVGQSSSQYPMQTMNTVISQSSQSVPGMSSNQSNPQFGNLSLATPYPSNEMVHTTNGEVLNISHIGQGHMEDVIQRSVQ
ncbi:hypothetical protein D8674_004138 [Pyrus ussuriensis x Pyrus communis]|uniref:Uncharacterized protein n=1 Tax=Pyrus ussuriensis x Pyrus communis TaxID=2448454 RepID=A0A5N5FJN3_9ROSA|nr:hypothetical protein D8674_004138 [Pyrus ussuriensis x Pyrus communis]